jgi:hypothetical protein
MRAGLFYFLFVVFALLFVSSAQKDKKQTYGDIASGQSVNVNKCNDCLVITIYYSLKGPVPEFITFQLTDEKLFQNTYDQKIRLSFAYQRLRQSQSVDLLSCRKRRQSSPLLINNRAPRKPFFSSILTYYLFIKTSGYDLSLYTIISKKCEKESFFLYHKPDWIFNRLSCTHHYFYFCLSGA